MTFTYTYRDGTGAKCDDVIEAANRAEVFAVLKTRGIVPLSVQEGGKTQSRSSSLRNVSRRSGKTASRVILVTIFLALGILSWLFWGIRHKDISDQTAIKDRRSNDSRRNRSGDVKEATTLRSNIGEKTSGALVSSRQVGEPLTNIVGDSVAKAVLPPPPTNRTFKTTTEQVLGHIFTTRLGDMPFPVPRLPDEELARIKEILDRDEPFKDSDNARTLDAKETVAAAKKEFAVFIADGGRPQDFLSYYHEVLRKAFEEYSMARDACEKVKEEQPELYDDFLESVNKRLGEKGIRLVERELDEDGNADNKGTKTENGGVSDKQET